MFLGLAGVGSSGWVEGWLALSAWSLTRLPVLVGVWGGRVLIGLCRLRL